MAVSWSSRGFWAHGGPFRRCASFDPTQWTGYLNCTRTRDKTRLRTAATPVGMSSFRTIHTDGSPFPEMLPEQLEGALVGQLEACHVDDASPGVCSVQLSATTRSSMTKTIKPPPGPTAVSMRMGCQLCSVRAFSSDCIAALLLPEISLNSDFCATLPRKETAVRIIRRAGTIHVARADLGRS